MAPHVPNTEDSIEQLIADISALTREVPAERLKDILNITMLSSQVSGSDDIRVLPSSAQMTKMLKAKKDKKHQSIGLGCGVFLSAVVVVISIFGIISAGQLYYGKDDIFFVSVQLLNNPLLKEILPKVIKSNIANYLQTSFTLLIRRIRSVTVESGIHPLGEHIQDGLSCVVSNPLYIEHKEDAYPCSNCANITYIRATKAGVEPQPTSPDVLLGPQPTIFRGWGKNVTMRQLEDQVLENLLILNSFPTILESNVDNVTKVQDLALDETINLLQADPVTHLTWYSEHYMTSHILRKLFGRPKLIPPDLTIELRKTLLVDGQEAPPYQLSSQLLFEFQAMWYSQGSGSRTVILTARDGCLDECPTLTARLRPGDILVYSPYTWSAHSMGNDKSASIALLGQFSY